MRLLLLRACGYWLILRGKSEVKFLESSFLNHMRWLSTILVLAAVYTLSARLSAWFSFDSSVIPPVSLHSGIALGAIWVLGFRAWPGVVLGVFAVNLNLTSTYSFLSLLNILVLALGQSLEAVIGVYLLKRLTRTQHPFDEPQNIYKSILAVSIACLLGAGINSTLQLKVYAPASTQWLDVVMEWLSHVVGVLTLLPAIVLLRSKAFRQMALSDLTYEVIGFFCILVIALVLVFSGTFSLEVANWPVPYIFIPAIGWAAYRFSQCGAFLASLLIILVSVGATTHRMGPFAAMNVNDAWSVLESFVVLASVTGLLLAADLMERRPYLDALLPAYQRVMHWLTFFVSLGLTVLAWHSMALNTERQAKERFDFVVRDIQSNISDYMKTYEGVLQSGVALYAASSKVERLEWKRFVDTLDLSTNFPGIQSIGFAQRVNTDQKDHYLNEIHEDGFASVIIKPVGNRNEYVPITYIEPLTERNRSMLGYDMLSENLRRTALIHARDSGKTSISAKVLLLKEENEEAQVGFLMCLPLYRNGVPIKTIQDRRAALIGYIYSPFRMKSLMKDIFSRSLSQFARSVKIDIFDGVGSSESARMFSSESTESIPAHARIEYINISLGGHVWTMRATALPAFENTVDRQKAQFILIAGTLISLFMFSTGSALASTKEKTLILAQKLGQALERSEVKFGALIQSLREGIVVADAHGQIMTWNQGATQAFGYTEEEIIGKNLMDLMPVRCHSLLVQKMARLQSSGQTQAIGKTLEVIGLTKEGREFPLEFSLAMWNAGETGTFYSGVMRDISERKQAETELQSTLAFQAAILNSANLSIIATNLEGTIISFNRAAQRMLGYTADEVVGCYTPEIFHDPEELMHRSQQLTIEFNRPIEPGFEVFVAKPSQGLVDENECTYICKDGRRLPVLLSVTPIRDQRGQVTGILGIAGDISERKQKDKMIRDALLEKETLLREVYHRVKNNLQVITSLFNMQSRTLPEGPARIALKEGAERVRVMALVHEKLYQSENLSSISLRSYITDLCKQLSHASAAQDRGIKFVIDVEPIDIGLDTAIPIGLVLNELILNSLKHAFPDRDEGEIRVSVRRGNDGMGMLEISDNGIGLSTDLVQAPSKFLGLRLVTTLSGQLDGKFVIENKQGGAHMHLTFKLNDAAPAAKGHA